MTVSAAEMEEMKATILREEKQIEDVVIEIGKLLESLSDVSQKQALCLAVAAWVGAADPARAFELSEHMRGEVDAYMIRLFGLKKPN
jgi:hypothetical protein